jgi:hypothetical protein
MHDLNARLVPVPNLCRAAGSVLKLNWSVSGEMEAGSVSGGNKLSPRLRVGLPRLAAGLGRFYDGSTRCHRFHLEMKSAY